MFWTLQVAWIIFPMNSFIIFLENALLRDSTECIQTGFIYVDKKLWYSYIHVLVWATVWLIMPSPNWVSHQYCLRANPIEIPWLKALIPEGSWPIHREERLWRTTGQTGLAGFPMQSASNYACAVKHPWNPRRMVFDLLNSWACGGYWSVAFPRVSMGAPYHTPTTLPLYITSVRGVSLVIN